MTDKELPPPMPRTTQRKSVVGGLGFVKYKPLHGAEAERATHLWFTVRGISPTLTEYREVFACMCNGSNPLGIH